MAKLILHSTAHSTLLTDELRLQENANLSPVERWKKMFALMQLAAALKTGRLKTPQGKGIILKSKRCRQ